MSKKMRGICPRQRKLQAVRDRMSRLLAEESELRLAGAQVPDGLKERLTVLEGKVAEISKLPSLAPCLFCDANVDLNGQTGHLMSVRHCLNIGTGELRYWGKGAADGLDAAICDSCIVKVNDYDDLITEEAEEEED